MKLVTIKNPHDLKGELELHYETTLTHCPTCGERNVVKEAGAGDFMLGCLHYCIECCATWHMPEGSTPEPDTSRKAEIDALREALTK